VLRFGDLTDDFASAWFLLCAESNAADEGRGAMKIVDLCEFYSSRGGGVRSYLTRMAQAASERGHELVVVAPGARDEVTRAAGGRVVQYAGPKMPYDPTYHAPLRIGRMRSLVERERPDVLQVSSPFLPAWVAGRIAAPRVRAYVHHSDPIGCYLRPFAQRHLPQALERAALAPAWAWLRRVSASMDVTITAGSWLTELLAEHGCARVQTVPFGIAHEQFGPQRADPELRARLLGRFAERDDARLLLITGRLAVDKRQHLLLRAAHELSRDFPIAVVVLGDGPERQRLVQLGRELPQVTFLPFVHERAAYASLLASVDLLLHGSACETFGFVIAETLASGTPVVVPDAGAAPHMVQSSCAQIYDAEGGPSDIAEATRRVLLRDRALVRAAAQRAAARHPTVDGHFDALFSLYERMLHGDLRAAA
jgi:alpha-1,6-mannosyltransferase